MLDTGQASVLNLIRHSVSTSHQWCARSQINFTGRQEILTLCSIICDGTLNEVMTSQWYRNVYIYIFIW